MYSFHRTGKIKTPECVSKMYPFWVVNYSYAKKTEKKWLGKKFIKTKVNSGA